MTPPMPGIIDTPFFMKKATSRVRGSCDSTCAFTGLLFTVYSMPTETSDAVIDSLANLGAIEKFLRTKAEVHTCGPDGFQLAEDVC